MDIRNSNESNFEGSVDKSDILDVSSHISTLGQELLEIDSSIHEYDKMQAFGPEEAEKLLQIQASLVTRVRTLDQLTRTFLTVLETPPVPEEPPTPEEIVPEIVISHSCGDVTVDLVRRDAEETDKFNFTATQKKIYEGERRKMKEEYHKLQVELKKAQKELASATMERESLCQRVGVINSAPVYECKVAMTAVVPTVKADVETGPPPTGQCSALESASGDADCPTAEN